MLVSEMITLAAAIKCDSIYGCGWRSFKFFRDYFESTGKKPDEARWYDNWPNPFGPNFSNETTYDDCVDWEVLFADSNATLRIVMWDGDMCYGKRTQKRCFWMFNLNDSMIPLMKIFEWKILDALDTRALHDEEKEEERLRKERIALRVKEYMKVLNKGE